MNFNQYTKSPSVQIIKHIKRDRNPETVYSNEMIDLERTKDNYTIVELQDYDKMLDDVTQKRAITDKTITMGQGIISLPKRYCREYKTTRVNKDGETVPYSLFFSKLTPEQEKDFFDKALKENLKSMGIREQDLICAEIHKDETTPHMHFCFLPITDKKFNRIDYVEDLAAAKENEHKGKEYEIFYCWTIKEDKEPKLRKNGRPRKTKNSGKTKLEKKTKTENGKVYEYSPMVRVKVDERLSYSNLINRYDLQEHHDRINKGLYDSLSWYQGGVVHEKKEDRAKHSRRNIDEYKLDMALESELKTSVELLQDAKQNKVYELEEVKTEIKVKTREVNDLVKEKEKTKQQVKQVKKKIQKLHSNPYLKNEKRLDHALEEFQNELEEKNAAAKKENKDYRATLNKMAADLNTEKSNFFKETNKVAAELKAEKLENAIDLRENLKIKQALADSWVKLEEERSKTSAQVEYNNEMKKLDASGIKLNEKIPKANDVLSENKKELCKPYETIKSRLKDFAKSVQKSFKDLTEKVVNAFQKSKGRFYGDD